MDNNIFQTVFDSLEADIAALDKDKAEYADLEAKIKEGRYSNQTLTKDVYPKLYEMKRKIESGCTNAIQKARGLVAQYREDADRLNDLNPSDITDDIKLLQAGIPLLPRDINAILERNKDNRTMTQLALRYAEEHGIKVDAYYIGGQAEKENADSLDQLISYYAKWIDKENAHEILRKYFDCVLRS